MLGDILPAPDLLRLRDAVDRGFTEHLLQHCDPRLANYRACNSCGTCTPFCPALYNSRTEPGKPLFLPRMVPKALQAGKNPDLDLQDCIQCYTCEVLCPNGISVGGIVNAFYEERQERSFFRSMLRTWGQLPAWAFLPVYMERGKIGPFVRKTASSSYSVHPRAIGEVSELLGRSCSPSSLSPNVPAEKAAPAGRIDTVFHLRSCCAFNFPGADRSQKGIFEALGIGYVTSDEQTCCGGAPYYMGGVSYAAKALLTARNLTVIHDALEGGAGAYITGICPTCSDSYTGCLDLLADRGNREVINGFLRDIDRRIDPGMQFRVANILDLLPPYQSDLSSMIEVPFSGLSAGVHVSCHYKKLSGSIRQSGKLSDLVGITGAKVVRSDMENYCCGGVKNLFDRYLGGERSILPELNRAVKRDVGERGIDLMIVDCPGCELVYDHMGVPVLHLAEFLGLAMGADPEETACLQHHITPVLPALRKADIL